jgi:3-hydroxyacyl-[acyl-carrier-protein] dehydratase
MRFLLVDHITDWKSDGLIRGLKNIAMSEDYLEFHFPRTPVMPGVLLLEAMVQLAGWLEARVSGFEKWFLMHRIRKCSFYGFALPGDQVELEVRLLGSADSKTRAYKGIGEINGKKKVKAEFEGELIGLSELEDIEEQRRFFRILTREPSLI